MAKINPRTGGVESHLDDLAVGILIASIILSAVCVYIAVTEPVKSSGQIEIYIIGALAIFGQGFFFWVLFKAASEIIRLLKKIAGLPYAGKLSETKGEGKDCFCADCGSPISVQDKYCTQCGEALEE